MDLKKEWKYFKWSVILPVTFVGLMWVIKIVEEVLMLRFGSFGVLPRDISGLKGILFSPLIHGDARVEGAYFGDFGHVFNNSGPMLVLGFLLIFMYRKVALKTFAIIWVLSGSLVWLFARQNYHIGASGVIYGLAAFIFFSGVFRRDVKAIALALLVAFWYGGMVWGVLPIEEGISFEGHLFGGVAGLISAILFRKVDQVEKHKWNEPSDKAPIVEDPFWVKKEKEVIEKPVVPPIQQKPKVDTELEALKRKINYDYKENRKPD